MLLWNYMCYFVSTHICLGLNPILTAKECIVKIRKNVLKTATTEGLKRLHGQMFWKTIKNRAEWIFLNVMLLSFYPMRYSNVFLDDGQNMTDNWMTDKRMVDKSMTDKWISHKGIPSNGGLNITIKLMSNR